MSKRYTYRTQNEVDAALNAKGIATEYTVLVPGVIRRFSQNMTLKGAKMEARQQARVNSTSAIVLHVPTGRIIECIPVGGVGA